MAGAVTKTILLAAGFLAALICWGPFAGAARYIAQPQPEVAVNRGVVELKTGRAAGISVRIAEDLADVVDEGATRRVLPVVGERHAAKHFQTSIYCAASTSPYCRTTSSTTPGSRTLPISRSRKPHHFLSPAVCRWNCICWRGATLKFVADLANQKVNVDLRGAGTEITATRLFNLLNVPIVVTNDDQQVALKNYSAGKSLPWLYLRASRRRSSAI